MSSNIDRWELVFRYRHGTITSTETVELEFLLQQDADFRRQFIQDLMLESTLAAFNPGPEPSISQTASGIEPAERSSAAGDYGRRLIVLVLFLMLTIGMAMSARAFWLPERTMIGRVNHVAGAFRILGSDGSTHHSIDDGFDLRVGDSIETRSCDAILELAFGDRPRFLMAGLTSLRSLESQGSERRFQMDHGTLWIQTKASDRAKSQTAPERQDEVRLPTAVVRFGESTINIQTSDIESIVRVDSGKAYVTTIIDDVSVEVPTGYQVYVSLRGPQELHVEKQPSPVDSWTCNLNKNPVVILGTWQPPGDMTPLRLSAVPLLWPMPDKGSIRLYAVSIAAWRSSPRPIALHSKTRLRIQGRLSEPNTVRLGFSTQRKHGVFGGKFESEVAIQELSSTGNWELDVPLDQFTSLQPELAESVDELLLTDVYALTVEKDAGLELTGLEIRHESSSNTEEPKE